MPVQNQKVTHENNKIYIQRPNFPSLAVTTYSEDLLSKISSTTWSIGSTKEKTYLRSRKFGYLHHLIFRYFYGEKIVDDAYKNNFVIDHLDNNSFDCTLENLALIPQNENKAKGFTLDQERIKSISDFSINITKDFNTDEFQISVAFNNPAILRINKEEVHLAVLYFRYDNNYKTVFIDARSILNDLNTTGHLHFSNLHFTAYDHYDSERFILTDKEIASGVAIRNGKVYIVQGSPNTFIVKPAHNKNLHTRE